MEGVQEQHLVKLLNDFNRNIYLDCVIKAEKLASECSDHNLFPSIDLVKTPDGAGIIAFRVSFSFPIFLLLSHPICRFRSHRNYPLQERFFANLGLVPVFSPTLDMMTVLKLWGNRAHSFFNPTNSPLSSTEQVCWELPATSNPSQFSSMNFLVQNSSEPVLVGNQLSQILEKYFALWYWSFPEPGFASSAHFLHGSVAISSQVKISKSLYIIEKIGNVTQFSLEGKIMEGAWVRMRGLARRNGNYQFMPFDAVVDMEITNQFLSKQKLKESIVNGIVSEIKHRSGKQMLMYVVAEYVESSYDLITALIGIVANERYYSSHSLCEICTLDQLREDVYELYFDVRRDLDISTTVSDSMQNLFGWALRFMFPVIITEDQKVFFVHPLIWGFLQRWKIAVDDDEELKRVVLSVLSLLQLTEAKNFTKLYLDSNADYLSAKGGRKHEIVRSIFQLAKEVRLAKTIKRVLDSPISRQSLN